MQHDDGQRLGILRYLIEGVEMIAVDGLSGGGRIVVVVGAGRAHQFPADGETALFLNHQGAGGT